MNAIEGQTGNQAFASHLGRRIEGIIETLLGPTTRTTDPGAVRDVVVREFAADPPIAGRRAVLLASSMASTYMRRFAPPSRWHLAGRNVRVGGGLGDLLYSDGELWFVDELKASRVRPDDPALVHQVSRYQLGRETYGDRFLGVRVALLRAPARLLPFPAPGACTPLPTARER